MSAMPTHLAYFISIRSFIHMEGVKIEEYYEVFLHMHNNAGRFATNTGIRYASVEGINALALLASKTVGIR